MPSCARSIHRHIVSLGFVLLCASVQAQSVAIKLDPVTATGTSVTVPVRLSGAAGPAAIQWTLQYLASDVQSVNVTDASAATAAGKSVTCASTPGQTICVLVGLNQNRISDGIVANAQLQLAATAQNTIPVQLTGTVAASPEATEMPSAGAGVNIPFVPVTLPVLTGVACTPATLTGPSSASCTVALDKAAPVGGARIAVSSNNPNLVVPATVDIAAGSTSAVFSATAAAISGANQTATVAATLGGVTKQAVVTLTATASLASLTCTPATIVGAGQVSCMVALDKAATSQLRVTLASNNPSLSVPATVDVATGNASAGFSATAAAISGANQTATVTATLGAVAKQAAVTLTATASLAGLTCTPATMVGPGSVSCTATLDKAAASSLRITLASNNPSLTVPATVDIAVGTMSAVFSGTAASISGANQTATVTATLGTVAKQAAVTLTATASLAGLTCTPATMAGPGSVSCTATLDKAAASSMRVTLASNNPSLTVPATVDIAAGSMSAVFSGTAASISGANQAATVTATLGAVSKQAVVTLTASAPSLTTVSCTPTTMVAPGSASCTVALNRAAASSLRVTLASNNLSLTVPATVDIAVGSSSATFQATALATNTSALTAAQPAQTVTVTATLDGVTKSVAIALVGEVKLTSLQCSPSAVFGGQSVSCTVSLSGVAGTSTAVALSANSTAVSIPTSVSVPIGSQAAQFTLTATSTTLSTTVKITASAAAGQKQTATVSVSPAPLFLMRGDSSEFIGAVNDSPVTPAYAPAGLTGKVVTRGDGYFNFEPINDTDGITFRAGGEQNTNTAYLTLAGQALGGVFKPTGKITFYFKSKYSFAERKALPGDNARYLFDAYDDTKSLFCFHVYTANGRLYLAYNTGGATTRVYAVALGQEDVLLGKGKTAKITLSWTAAYNTLSINDRAVSIQAYSKVVPNWTSRSSITIGAKDPHSTQPGFFALDEVIADLEIR